MTISPSNTPQDLLLSPIIGRDGSLASIKVILNKTQFKQKLLAGVIVDLSKNLEMSRSDWVNLVISVSVVTTTEEENIPGSCIVSMDKDNEDLRTCIKELDFLDLLLNLFISRSDEDCILEPHEELIVQEVMKSS